MRSFLNRVFYYFVRGLLGMIFRCAFRFRWAGAEHLPAQGATLLLCNHQSYLDPLLAAVACKRRLRAMARESLFFFPLGPIIRALGAVPVDQRSAVAGIRRTIEMLDNDEAVLIYPEGSRSEDGQLAPMQPGILLLIRRTKPQLAFAGLDGAFEAWPRHARLPRLRSIAIQFAPPVAAADYEPLSNDELLALVHDRIEQCIAGARKRRLGP